MRAGHRRITREKLEVAAVAQSQEHEKSRESRSAQVVTAELDSHWKAHLWTSGRCATEIEVGVARLHRVRELCAGCSIAIVSSTETI